MIGKKMDVRRKAVESMLEEGPALSIKSKAARAGEVDDAEKLAQEGYMQMMVSPEEKAMILKMRGEPDQGQEPAADDIAQG
jgi:hypothetical protein